MQRPSEHVQHNSSECLTSTTSYNPSSTNSPKNNLKENRQQTLDGNFNKRRFWPDTLNIPVKSDHCKSLDDLRSNVPIHEIAHPQFIITSPTSADEESNDLLQE